MVSQKAIATTVPAHVDDDRIHAIFIHLLDHSLPQLHGEQIVIEEAENLHVANALIFQEIVFQRQFKTVARLILKPEVVAIYLAAHFQRRCLRRAARILEGYFHFGACGETGGEQQLIQPLRMRCAVRCKIADGVVQIIANWLTVHFQNFGTQLHARFGRRAVFKQEVDENTAVCQFPNSNANAAIRRRPEIIPDERARNVPVGDLPGEVAQRPQVFQLIIVGVRFFKTGVELVAQRFPVDPFVFGEGILIFQLIH